MPRRHRHPPLRRILRQTAGWLCLLLGVIGLLVPVMPQLPFLAAGALLLAPYLRMFRRVSAWVHLRFPKWRRPLRRFRDFKVRPPD